ncbi:radiation-inducible immediate-early gene IEX-1 [Poeciliopsis prolifica]|uniref:radiation-inducible immediate-early gene IEX-1 n=1 Tax=Poeciliopsis prolifica TaxID=188132 RepID=UPI00241313D2|nr:radiation-inducible immediate-early gene IEX-1 [Poeciliopsis prolifica]
MYSRSDSVTLTVQESFAFSTGMATRSTQPEVFTFERIPPQATAVRSYVPIRPKKRCTRVMYPAKVRMHLPPPERSQAKRWLLILCLVVLWQIYTEEPCVDVPLSADGSISDYQGFGFQSAEQQARQMSERSAAQIRCEEAAQQSDSSGFEQSAGKSMVALLVYHTLGNDN